MYKRCKQRHKDQLNISHFFQAGFIQRTDRMQQKLTFDKQDTNSVKKHNIPPPSALVNAYYPPPIVKTYYPPF